MERIEIMKELDVILQICKDNECGMECEHAHEVRKFGDRLIKATKENRKKRGIEEPDQLLYDKLDYKEVKSMIDQGMTNKEILKELNACDQTYYQFLRRNKLTNTNKGELMHKGYKVSFFYELFKKGMATIEIAKMLNINDKTLRGFFVRNNIKNPNNKKGKKK
jgi:DNA invertase Pin-like site-specific DNA recombinase